MRHLHDVGGEACLSVGLLLGGRSVELLQVGVAGLLGHRLPEGRGDARPGGGATATSSPATSVSDTSLHRVMVTQVSYVTRQTQGLRWQGTRQSTRTHESRPCTRVTGR